MKDVSDHLGTEPTGLDDMLVWCASAPAARMDPAQHPTECSLPPSDGPSGRALIYITTEEEEVGNQAIAALAGRNDIYQRGHTLVHVVREGGKLLGITREPDTPRIVALPLARLREQMAASVQWLRRVPSGGRSRKASAEAAGDDTVAEWVPAHPPDWAVRAVAARGQWEAIRFIEAVVECPVLRPDGTVLREPGFDEQTGILCLPNVRVPRIAERPTRESAQRALEFLVEAVVDFPFATPAHRTAWVAAVLTPFARYAFSGPAPLNLIDANVRGAGKSLLADVIGTIVSGRQMPRMSPAEDDTEERKRITALALSGDALVLIDNVTGTLGTPSLDAALTATSWTDRLLGGNTQVRLPLVLTWFCTGNNVALAGDTSRRCLHIRLESAEEHPEERAGFKYPNLLGWVRENRPKLIAACLTILRAYCVAGRPPTGLRPWGSFDGWSALVREAIVWAGYPDPGETRMELQADADRDVAALADFVAGWAELVRFDGPCTVAQALRELADKPGRFQTLRDALVELTGAAPGQLPSATKVGKLLSRVKGRVFGGRAIVLRKQSQKGGSLWTVKSTSEGGGGVEGESRGHSSLYGKMDQEDTDPYRVKPPPDSPRSPLLDTPPSSPGDTTGEP